MRQRCSHHRPGWFVSDPEPDPHPTVDPLEPESSLLFDQARFRDPADRLWPAPAVQPKDVLERYAHGDDLDVVASPYTTGFGADRLPAADPLQHLRDVVIIGEVIEGLLGRRLDIDRRFELQPSHHTKICTWSPAAHA